MFSHLVFNTRFDRFDFTHMFKFKKKKRSSFLKLESMLLVDAYYVKRKCQIQIQFGTLEHVEKKTNNVTKHET